MSRANEAGGGAVIILAVLLVAVFALSVALGNMLDSAPGDSAVAVFAAGVREYVACNETVAVFLGLDGAEEIRTGAFADREEELSAAVRMYIDIYNDRFGKSE